MTDDLFNPSGNREGEFHFSKGPDLPDRLEIDGTPLSEILSEKLDHAASGSTDIGFPAPAMSEQLHSRLEIYLFLNVRKLEVMAKIGEELLTGVSAKDKLDSSLKQISDLRREISDSTSKIVRVIETSDLSELRAGQAAGVFEALAGMSYSIAAKMTRDPKAFHPSRFTDLMPKDVIVHNGERKFLLSTSKDEMAFGRFDVVKVGPDWRVETERIDLQQAIDKGEVFWAERSDYNTLTVGVQTGYLMRGVPFSAISPGDVAFGSVPHISGGDRQEEFLITPRTGDPRLVSIISELGAPDARIHRREFSPDDRYFYLGPFIDITKREVTLEPDVSQSLLDQPQRSPRESIQAIIRASLKSLPDYAERELGIVSGTRSSRSDTIFGFAAAPKVILQFQDDVRKIVLGVEGGVLHLASYDGSEVTEEHVPIKSLESDPNLVAIEPSRESVVSLIKGNQFIRPMARPTWARMKPGTMICFPDQSREEILRIDPVPLGNNSLKYVTSLKYTETGVELRRNVLRADMELATEPVTVYQKEVLQHPPHPAQKADDRLQDTFAGKICRKVGSICEQLEERLAENYQKYSDLLNAKFPRDSEKVIDLGTGRSFSPKEKAFEGLLKSLKRVHRRMREFQDSFAELATHAFLASAGDGADPVLNARCDEGLKKIGAAPRSSSLEELEVIFESAVHPIVDSISQRLLHLQSEGKESVQCQEVNRRLRALGRTFYTLQERTKALGDQFSDIQRGLMEEPRVWTQRERAGSVTEETLARIEQLTNSSEGSQSGSKVSSQGVIINNYYTRAYLRSQLEQGAELITHWVKDPDTDQKRMNGFILFYHPAKVPADAKGLRDEYRDNPLVGYSDLVLTEPGSTAVVRRRLYAAQTLHRQRTEARYTYGEVLCQNVASAKGVMKMWGHPDLQSIGISEGPDGKPTYWIPYLAPEDPETSRRLLRGSQDSSYDYLVEQLRRRAETPPAADRILEKHPEEARQLVGFYQYAREEAEVPVFIAVSGGAANLAPEGLAKIKDVLGGITRISGIITWGSTMMLQCADGEPDKPASTPRAGMQRVMHELKGSASPKAIFLGMNVYDPATARKVSVSGLNNGEPILVVSSEPDSAIITVEDFEVPSLHFAADATAEAAVPFWDVEAIRRRELARLFREDKGAGPEKAARPFMNLAIFGGGGGVIGREIADWGEEAVKDLSDRTHVVLIKGSTGSTDKFIAMPVVDDPAYNYPGGWVDKQNALAAAQGRGPVVHVVDSRAEMDDLLRKFGALVSPEVSDESTDHADRDMRSVATRRAIRSESAVS